MRDTRWEGWLKEGVSSSITFGIAFPMHSKNENWSFNVLKKLFRSVNPTCWKMGLASGATDLRGHEGSTVLHLNHSTVTEHMAQMYRTAQCPKLSVTPQCGLGWSDLDLRGEEEGPSG